MSLPHGSAPHGLVEQHASKLPDLTKVKHNHHAPTGKQIPGGYQVLAQEITAPYPDQNGVQSYANQPTLASAATRAPAPTESPTSPASARYTQHAHLPPSPQSPQAQYYVADNLASPTLPHPVGQPDSHSAGYDALASTRNPTTPSAPQHGPSTTDANLVHAAALPSAHTGASSRTHAGPPQSFFTGTPETSGGQDHAVPSAFQESDHHPFVPGGVPNEEVFSPADMGAYQKQAAHEPNTPATHQQRNMASQVHAAQPQEHLAGKSLRKQPSDISGTPVSHPSLPSTVEGRPRHLSGLSLSENGGSGPSRAELSPRMQKRQHLASALEQGGASPTRATFPMGAPEPRPVQHPGLDFVAEQPRATAGRPDSTTETQKEQEGYLSSAVHSVERAVEDSVEGVQQGWHGDDKAGQATGATAGNGESVPNMPRIAGATGPVGHYASPDHPVASFPDVSEAKSHRTQSPDSVQPLVSAASKPGQSSTVGLGLNTAQDWDSTPPGTAGSHRSAALGSDVKHKVGHYYDPAHPVAPVAENKEQDNKSKRSSQQELGRLSQAPTTGPVLAYGAAVLPSNDDPRVGADQVSPTAAGAAGAAAPASPVEQRKSVSPTDSATVSQLEAQPQGASSGAYNEDQAFVPENLLANSVPVNGRFVAASVTSETGRSMSESTRGAQRVLSSEGQNKHLLQAETYQRQQQQEEAQARSQEDAYQSRLRHQHLVPQHASRHPVNLASGSGVPGSAPDLDMGGADIGQSVVGSGTYDSVMPTQERADIEDGDDAGAVPGAFRDDTDRLGDKPLTDYASSDAAASGKKSSFLDRLLHRSDKDKQAKAQKAADKESSKAQKAADKESSKAQKAADKVSSKAQKAADKESSKAQKAADKESKRNSKVEAEDARRAGSEQAYRLQQAQEAESLKSQAAETHANAQKLAYEADQAAKRVT